MKTGGVKRLNNFVGELLNVRIDTRKSSSKYGFINPRKGWVFISLSGLPQNGVSFTVSIDSGGMAGPLLVWSKAGTENILEAMHLLPRGKYILVISHEGRGSVGDPVLIVRSVPEVLYAEFQYDPWVTEYGSYDWNFLSKHLLPSVNVIIEKFADKVDEHKPYIEQWRSRGKRWILGTHVPKPQESYQFWSENPGLRNSLLDGIIVDEFNGFPPEYYAAWTTAVKKIFEKDQFKGKLFYPYCGNLFSHPKGSREFLKTIVDCGSKFVWECYLKEQPTLEKANEALDVLLRQGARAWRRVHPDFVKHMIVALSYLSAPPESCNTNPGISFKVWMDMQFNFLANDPTFRGLYGVEEYTAGYADEEIMRWTGKLFRHYCIEGRAELISERYGYTFVLPHVQNPDFADGMKGWSASPAEPGTIAARQFHGFGWLQGRYPRTPEGDTFLWTRRSLKGPNTISQEIRQLDPGRLYSLKMYTADYGALYQGESIKEQKHGVRVMVDNAELILEKSFRHVYPNCYSHHLGSFNNNYRFWMNYHLKVFRAKGRSCLLSLSDWFAENEPGGPAGQELIYNFIEVQPYLED